MAFKDSHRMFLQSFMSRGILNAGDVFELLKRCCDRYNEAMGDKRQTLLNFVRLINDKVRVFGMEIKKVVDEIDGTSHYGLVNTEETSITLLASTYTDNELQLFKKLVEMIILSDDGTVSSIEAVNISDTLSKKMSKHDADHLLDRFTKEKWIGKNKSGQFYLGMRGILELEQYILDMYGESAVRCNLCKKLCVQGESCDNCNTKFHRHCAAKYFKEPSVKCPGCHTPWERVYNQEPQPSTSAEGEEQATQNHAEDHNGSADEPSTQPGQSTQVSRKRKAR